MTEWQTIDTAPQDGRSIFGQNAQTMQRGMVFLNSQDEWEAVTCNNTPAGYGFYPTHWMPLPQPPIST